MRSIFNRIDIFLQRAVCRCKNSKILWYVDLADDGEPILAIYCEKCKREASILFKDLRARVKMDKIVKEKLSPKKRQSQKNKLDIFFQRYEKQMKEPPPPDERGK